MEFKTNKTQTMERKNISSQKAAQDNKERDKYKIKKSRVQK